MRGAVSFVGAGPGAADLITLRGASRIAEADLVLYAPGDADPVWLREHTKAGAELVDLTRLGADELLERYRRLASRRHRAVRLVPGDPVAHSELREQRETCLKLGLDVDVVPGVSPVSATAAAIGSALTEPGGPDTLVLTGAEADFDRVREVASATRTLAVQAPAARAAELAEALTAAGLDSEVPVVVSYKVSRPDETLLRTTLGEVAAAVKGANLWRSALFLVGDATRQAKPRAGYTPGEAPAGQRWKSRRTSGEARTPWVKRAAVAADEPEPAAPDTEAAVETAPGPVATRTAVKKQQSRSPRTTARRAGKKS